MLIKLFYRAEMNVFESFHPDFRNAEKPKLFLDRVQQDCEVINTFKPLSVEEISVSHDRRHVERVLAYDKNNGYGNCLKSVTDTLPWELGSFYYAAKEAFNSAVTISPSAGFHHADYKECWNLCSFNGLTIAALLLKNRDRMADKVGIIDFDCHWGNGTDAIIEYLKLNFIEHYSFGKFKRIIRKGMGFDAWLDQLPSILEDKFREADILFYQAGVDAHRDDRFGGELTTEQMTRRDAIVFHFAKAKKIPLVWNLAGGYQEPYSKVLDLHKMTFDLCNEIYR